MRNLQVDPSLRRTYADQGYLLLESALEPGELREALSQIHAPFLRQMARNDLEAGNGGRGVPADALFRLFEIDQEAYVRCLKVAQRVPALYGLGLSEGLRELMRGLGLESPVFSTKPQLFMNSPHTSQREHHWRVPVHQDWRSIQGSLNSVVVWIPLVDVPRELGALEVVPGSHTRGLLPSEHDDWYAHVQEDFVDEDEFVSCPMNAGDLLVFSTFLVHRSGTNASDEIRYSIQYRFNDLAEETFVERGYPDPYVSRPKKELLTPSFPDEGQVESYFQRLSAEGASG